MSFVDLPYVLPVGLSYVGHLQTRKGLHFSETHLTLDFSREAAKEMTCNSKRAVVVWT